MILIADSGSTKTHWCMVEGTEIVQNVITEGINPYYQTVNDVRSIVECQLLPSLNGSIPEIIYFYGAGCAFEEKKNIISQAVGYYFKSAVIKVESDLVASCRELFQNKQGIACILGTGSNSCLYDGEKVIKNVSPLGFILGDEGSGALLGKRLISDCFKNQLPADLSDKLKLQYNLTAESVLDCVYKKQFPSRFLAGFCVFLKENIEHPAIYDIVYSEFDRFFDRNILQYPYQDNKVGFVGSIAWHFRDVLTDVARKNGVIISSIVQNPMEGLIAFHSLQK